MLRFSGPIVLFEDSKTDLAKFALYFLSTCLKYNQWYNVKQTTSLSREQHKSDTITDFTQHVYY